MNFGIRPLVLSVIACAGLLVPSWAETAPDALVLSVSQNVLAEVKQLRSSYAAEPDRLESAIARLLEPVVDFPAVARGIMGKYYDQATPDERSAFERAFRRTLINIYTRTLVGTEISDISVKDINQRTENSASVSTEVRTTDGKSYVVQYSMRRDEGGEWVVRNIILDGINLGLTYRNQFSSAMEQEADVATVVRKWPDLIDGSE